MAFTDEDLKIFLDKHGDQVFYMSLLSRLEAAEYALLRMSIMSHMYTTGIDEAVEAWRKSKGENK